MKIINKFKDSKTGADAILFEGGILFLDGTKSIKDVFKDLDFFPIKAWGAIGHKGAYEQANFIFQELDWGYVKEIHGYSLGGAAALWLGIMSMKPVYSYGAFRPFKQIGKHPQAINQVYGADIIPCQQRQNSSGIQRFESSAFGYS